MTETRSIEELERRIAIVRDNVSQLIEQAAARSGAADEALASDRINQQSEELERLTKERDALVAAQARKA
jgi:predicted ATPase